MMIHRHRSFFPAVLAVLTLALGGTIFMVVRPHPEAEEATVGGVPAEIRGTPAQEAYIVEMNTLIQSIGVSPDAATLDRTLSALLKMRVPSSAREGHLASANALMRWRDAVKAKDPMAASKASGDLYIMNERY